MSARYPSQSLGHGLGTAFVLSICGAAALAALAPFVGTGTALRAVIALLGLAYALYLLGRSGERSGRILTIALWIVCACLTWFASLPLVAYVLVHAGLVWLVRSLYYYSGPLPALADFGVTALGVAFAAWSAQRSDSVWLALWCFFLVQAFHVLIPAATGPHEGDSALEPGDAFARAHRAAESALRRLSSAR